MADENKTNPFSKTNAPPTGDAQSNATATTTPQADGDKPAAEVSDAEAASLDGGAGPNRTPAFSKRDFEDENVQLTDTDDLQSAKDGAAAHGGSTLDLIGMEAAAAAGPELEGQEDTVQFTSTPIASLRLGRFQFQNGVLRLSQEDAGEFEKLLEQAAIRTKQVIRRIDRAGGEAVARKYLDTAKSRSVRGTDTSDRTARTAPSPADAQA